MIAAFVLDHYIISFSFLILILHFRDDLEFGPVVAKGCNAVVYSARWRKTDPVTLNETSTAIPITPKETIASSESTSVNETKPITLNLASEKKLESSVVKASSHTVERQSSIEVPNVETRSPIKQRSAPELSQESVSTSSESEVRQPPSEINLKVENIEPPVTSSPVKTEAKKEEEVRNQ